MNLYRSLSIERPSDESLLKILERLAGEGYLQNNRKFDVEFNGSQNNSHLDVQFDFSSNSRFVEVVCSMENLKLLDLLHYELTLEDLARVFQSCSKVTNLLIPAKGRKMSELDEHLKNQLKIGFQRLRRLYVQQTDDDSWPVIQEMLT